MLGSILVFGFFFGVWFLGYASGRVDAAQSYAKKTGTDDTSK